MSQGQGHIGNFDTKGMITDSPISNLMYELYNSMKALKSK